MLLRVHQAASMKSLVVVQESAVGGAYIAELEPDAALELALDLLLKTDSLGETQSRRIGRAVDALNDELDNRRGRLAP